MVVDVDFLPRRKRMRYKDSIDSVILIEREQGATYKEIAEKLNISIYKVLCANPMNHAETNTKRDRPERKRNSKD